nr:PREDICTED: MAGUK p55 subfamily member 6-like [Paralichthys olivaceus]
MVTAMEDACPNGVREEKEEEVTALRHPGVEVPPAERSTQAAETSGAMQQVLDNVGELPTSAGAKDIDLLFLRGIMESPIAHEQLEEVKLEAVQDNNVELVTDIIGDINNLKVKDDSAAELSKILKEPHFQSLLEAHDMVASKCYEVPPPAEMANDAAVNSALMQADAVRMIGIRKKAGEPLGVTFRVEKDDLVIARILHGGMIDRQGLLHVGDIIKEVNGKDVGNNPTELQEMLKDCSGGITLKILPSYRDAPAPPQVADVGQWYRAGDVFYGPPTIPCAGM